MRRPLFLLPLLLLAGLVLAPTRPAHAVDVVLPVDIGVGPAAHWVTGPIGDEFAYHPGIKLSVAAVLDNAMIRKLIHRVPPKYQAQALQMQEFRYSPSIFIPDSLVISPGIGHSGMYGVTWEPWSLSVALARAQTNLDVSLGAILTYAFMQSDTQVFSTLHFLRPGLAASLKWEVPVTDRFLFSLGWASQLYIPQKLQGPFLEMGGFDDASIWHVGQAFLMLHWRFDYAASL
jgi:hypothetical protein